MDNKIEILVTIDPLQHSTTCGIGKYNEEIVYFDITKRQKNIPKNKYSPKMLDIIKNYIPSNDSESNGIIYMNKYYTICNISYDDNEIVIWSHNLFNIYRTPPNILEELQMYAYGFFDEEETYHRYDSIEGLELISKYHNITKNYSEIVFDKWMEYYWNIPVRRFEWLGTFSFENHSNDNFYNC